MITERERDDEEEVEEKERKERRKNERGLFLSFLLVSSLRVSGPS